MHSPQRTVVFADSPVAVAAGERLIICDCSGGPIVLNLPTALASKSRTLEVIKTDASANAATLTPAGGQTINGAATLAITTQWQLVGITSDGSNYIGLYGAVGQSGGASADPLGLAFFAAQGLLPANKVMEALNTFPPLDFANLKGQTQVITMAQMRQQRAAGPIAQNNWGWTLPGAPYGKVLFIFGAIRGRRWSTGIFIATAQPSTVFFQGYNTGQNIFAPGHYTSKADGVGGSTPLGVDDPSVSYDNANTYLKNDEAMAVYADGARVAGFIRRGGQWQVIQDVADATYGSFESVGVEQYFSSDADVDWFGCPIAAFAE